MGVRASVELGAVLCVYRFMNVVRPSEDRKHIRHSYSPNGDTRAEGESEKWNLMVAHYRALLWFSELYLKNMTQIDYLLFAEIDANWDNYGLGS